MLARPGLATTRSKTVLGLNAMDSEKTQEARLVAWRAVGGSIWGHKTAHDDEPLYDQAALDAAVAAERERLIEALRREALNKWTVRSQEAFAWAQAALERA